jgi:hypothetical protein
MAVPKAVDQLVRARAKDRCEYCLAPQSASKFRFWIDHIIASQHLGPTSQENLALPCPFCNRHKGTNLFGIDAQSGSASSLFNPRRDVWDRHFQIAGDEIVGISPTGRATVQTLAMNHPAQRIVRRALLREGLFPPAPTGR